MISPDGNFPVPAPQAASRCSYSQNWPIYNLAATQEKERFLPFLKDLCATIEQAPQGRGRPRLLLADMVFACVYKTYSGFSSRRFSTDIRAAMNADLVDHAPHFNSTNRYMANPALTPVLKSLIELSASPLAVVEDSFAIDSTGFSTSVYARWFDAKWGKERSKTLWVKTHLMTGTLTNIVSAVESTAFESADAPQLEPLLKTTAKTFSNIREVSGDKAYNSKRNYAAIDAIGAEGYIPFKSYSQGHTKSNANNGAWTRMWHLYNLHRDEFNAHYHKRSNAESTMAMIKAKFGGSVKSKTADGQVNEVLCKVLAHNICVLIQSQLELGIEPHFASSTPEPKVIDLNQYRLRMGL